MWYFRELNNVLVLRNHVDETGILGRNLPKIICSTMSTLVRFCQNVPRAVGLAFQQANHCHTMCLFRCQAIFKSSMTDTDNRELFSFPFMLE